MGPITREEAHYHLGLLADGDASPEAEAADTEESLAILLATHAVARKRAAQDLLVLERIRARALNLIQTGAVSWTAGL